MPDTTSATDLAARVKAEALRLGFDAAGVAPIRASDHAAFYQAWIEDGRHGTMAYLARPDAVERRCHPERAWHGVRSALVVAHNYNSVSDDAASSSPERAIIARYARGRDYHKVIRKKLLALLRWLEEEVGHALPAARAYVDTGPVLEREIARRAGLGWFGRNTMLIHPRRGSYFFLGSLLLELELEPDEPFVADHCGTCNACVEACPTGALLGRDANGAPVMDATRCISYLTIEQRGPIPVELRPLMGNRVFGCDICQEVCPFTRTFSRPATEPAYASRAPGKPPFGVEPEPGSSSPSHPGTAAPSLIALLETALDEAAWNSFSRGSAIRRAGRAGLARNVCVGLGNWGAPEAVPVLTSALSDPEPLVRAHAAWALGRVDSAEARAALSSRFSVEPDESARAELAAALRS
ncbi:MAG: tRNA epoxyqueuosine(34) reductase QueG [Gemmatimonadota bacterium]